MLKKTNRKNLFSVIFAKPKLYGFIAVLLIATISLPVVLNKQGASAYGLVSFRTIGLSNSAASGTATYSASFRPFTTASTVGGIVIDFCVNDPIIGDSCTAPTGFTLLANATINAHVSLGTGFSTSTGSWAATSCGSTPCSTLFFTNATPQTVTGSSTPIQVTITNVTNPNSVEQYFARIYTFDTQAHANAYTATGANTGLIDAGGVALDTVQQITIQSKVQEQLYFCMYIATTPDTGSLCAAVSGSQVCLGLGETEAIDASGTCTNKDTLSTSTDFVDNSTLFDLTSNAVNGVNMYMYSNGADGTLFSSAASHHIESSGASGTGSVNTTTYAIDGGSPPFGTEQFGMCANQVATFGSGLTIAAPYNDGGCSGSSEGGSGGTAAGAKFGFDTTSMSTGNGLSLVASTSTGNANSGRIAFGANIAPTTPAGIYTTQLTFIANATY